MIHGYKKAFTMLELTFVIVVIGILSAIAIPKFAATRDDAVISKAKITVASVRNAIAIEKQKRTLKGKFTAIYALSGQGGYNHSIFDAFDRNTSNPVLEYPLTSCRSNSQRNACWLRSRTGIQGGRTETYIYYFPTSETGHRIYAYFELKNNRFVCSESRSRPRGRSGACMLLTR